MSAEDRLVGSRPPAAAEVALTRCTVGMWSSRRHCACHLLLLEQQLVVLVDMRSSMPRSPSRFGALHGRLAAASPFLSSSRAGCVHAFEVPAASIRGLDYSNPLMLEARLVLETVGLRKREFPTLEVARAYYLERAVPPCSSSASAAAQRNGGDAPVEAALTSHPPRRACGNDAAVSERGEGPSMGTSHRSSARSNLALRLEGACTVGNSAEERGGAAPQGSSRPVPIGRHGDRVGVRFCSAVATEVEAAAAATAQPSDDGAPPGGRCLNDDDDAAFESEFGSQWYWGSPTRNSSPPAAANGAVEAAAAAAVAQGSSAASSVASSTDATLEQREGLAGSAPASPSATDSSTAGFVSPASSPPALKPSRGSAPPHRQPHAAYMPRAASEGQLLSAGQRRKQRRQAQQAAAQPQAGGEEAGWTPAHAFTRGRDFRYRTVVLHWSDPRVPGALRPVIQGNERLLKLYESGLPAWAIYAPQYGLFYRPWLRSVTWALFYAFSAFSFAMGFYDLLKAVPGLQVVLRRLMASVWLPPAAVLEWLEQHTQIRLSILLTYLFGKSEALVWIMRWAHNFMRASRGALQPVLELAVPPVAALCGTLRLAGSQAWQSVAALGSSLAAVCWAVLGPLLSLLVQLWAAVGAAVMPLAQGRFLWLTAGCQQLASAASQAWQVAAQAAAGLAGGVAALAGTVRAGQAVGSATSRAAAGQAAWLSLLPMEALEVLRTSSVKAARAAQAVGKFFVQLGSSAVRHRLTLELRAGRAWRRAKQRLRALALAPLLLGADLLKWLLIAVRFFFAEQAAQGSQEARRAQQRPDLRSGEGAKAAGVAAPPAAIRTLTHRRPMPVAGVPTTAAT